MKILIAVPDSKAKALKKVIAGFGATVLSEGESPIQKSDVLNPELEEAISEMKKKVDDAILVNDNLKATIETLTSEKNKLEETVSTLETAKADLEAKLASGPEEKATKKKK